MDSDLKLEWQRTLKDGQVRLTEFQRLLMLIDRDAIRHSVDPPTSSAEANQAELPDEDILETEEKPEPVVDIAGPADRELAQERSTLLLAIGEGRSWPKRITVKLRDETPLATFYKNRAEPASKPFVVEKTDLSNGNTVSLDVMLPAKARLQTGADVQLCFFIDQATEPDSCHPMKWMGKPAPATPRRLWALFIGVSKTAEGSHLDLQFPENDAIDIARLFIGDYEGRVEHKTTRQPPDFTRIRVDIAVSAFPGAAEEAAKLAEHKYVTLRGAEKADIAVALQKIAQDIAELNRREPGDDLFLMTYSGHGMVDPNRPGGTVLVTADAAVPVSTEHDLRLAAAKALSSQELLHLIRQIAARKVIIIDACRSLADLPVARPFSPELMRTEFEQQALDTHFFFSSDVGQESFELDAPAFDTQRPKDRQGNGLFTYALLNALTKPRSDVHTAAMAGRIDIPWIADFMRNIFFNRANPKSPANLLKAEYPESLPYVPTPKYIPARSDHTDQLMRTLDILN